MVTPLQLLKIAAWKSARSLANLTLNDASVIEEQSRAALAALWPYRNAKEPSLDEAYWAATEKGYMHLRTLIGIRLRLASAVLCILNPQAWPVIDRRAARALFGVERFPEGFLFYRAYVTRLVELLQGYPKIETIHELDQKLYGVPPLPVDRVDWQTYVASVITVP